MAVVAAPNVEREYELGHGGYALLVFALPLIGGALLEAGLALLSDRYPRRQVVRLASFAAAAALVLCALAPVGALLAVGLMLAGTASGVACSAAKGELVLGTPSSAARAMARWTLLGALGDVLTPVLVAAILSAGHSYRTAFLAAAILAALQAFWLAPRAAAPRPPGTPAPPAASSERTAPGKQAALRAETRPRAEAPLEAESGLGTQTMLRAETALEAESGLGAKTALRAESALGAKSGLEAKAAERAERGLPAEAEPEDVGAGVGEEESVPLLVALRQGIGQRRLWLWLVGAGMCTFLDEIVIALAALHAERDLGASGSAAVAHVTAASLGSVVGAWLTERLLGTFAPDRVLFGSAASALAALIAVVAAPSLAVSGLALFVLGVTVAPQFALLEAKAYGACPGRPGVVTALSQVFVLVDIAGPLALGLVADAFGLRTALACLAVQPLAVAVVLACAARRREPSSAGGAHGGAGE